MVSVKWRHVWITGASSGLGEHVARLIAQDGIYVSISARSKDKLEAIAASNPNIFAYPCDVTDEKAVKRVAKKVAAAHGPIDLAIFSAGAWFQSSISEMKVKNVEKTFDVNVLGMVRALDAVLPDMLARGDGHISWIASVAGYGGLPASAAYGASKSALITFAESIKSELERKGIAVSVVNPGFVKTPLTDKNDFPMPFLMEPEDAAKKIVAGLEKEKFEIAFPWQLVAILKFLNHLPYWLYFWLIRKLVLRK